MKKKRRKKESFLGAPKPSFIPSAMADPKPAESKKGISKPFIVGVIVVGVIILGAAAIYIFAVTRENTPIPNKANLELAQVQEVIDNVAKLMDIPEGEAPIMLYVSNADNLKSQDFFKNAENGDRVMVFKSSKQAILYRASTNKIISATFATDQEIEAIKALAQPKEQVSTQSADIKAPTPSASNPKVVILNGTKEAGLAKKASKLLDEDSYDVVGTGNTQGDYDKTTVVDVSKSTNIPSSKISGIISTYSKIKTTIQKLPPQEAAPAGAEVVIILGNDFSEAY